MDGTKNNTYILAGSIVLAALLIVFGIYAVNKDGENTPPEVIDDEGERVSINISPVTGSDHIIGSANASLAIVEYSDTECPFCKDFHSVMKNVMEKYKDGEEVVWVYRHFPLTSIHPKATKEAHATECANELGGNDAFWKYINRLYDITPSNNNLDLSLLPGIAEEAGLDKEAFEECQDSKKFDNKINASYKEAVGAGATGTPYNVFVLREPMSDEVLAGLKQITAQFRPGQVIISDDRTKISLGGALSEQGIESFISLLLYKIESEQLDD